MLRSNEPEAAWAKAEVAWARSRSGDIHSKAPVGGTAFEQGVTERAPGQAGRSQERRGTGCRPEGTGPCNGAWDEAPEETLLTTHTPAHLPEAGGAPRHLGLGRRAPRNGAGSMGQNGPQLQECQGRRRNL